MVNLWPELHNHWSCQIASFSVKANAKAGQTSSVDSGRLFEALAGAVFLDASVAEAQQVVAGWLQVSIEAASPSDVVDAKTRLQEWLQGGQTSP
ncbi:MAG: hypothetical protein CM15mP84_06800 [Cellvibrionales bacterium]|nr:MAG: hypothetical protein CM15mP84_06800 [Cellvibrionales bacterium]